MKKSAIACIVAGIIIVIVLLAYSYTLEEESKGIPEETNIQTESKIADTVIFWDENRSLTLDDFQGIIGGPNAQNDEVVAQSNVGFRFPPYYEIEITNNGFCEYEMKNYEVLAHFNKTKSWIKLEKIERSNSHVATLNHEQRHFDIVEIYSRILIKLINDEFRNKKISCPDVSNTSLESSIFEEVDKRKFQLESMINARYQKTQDTYEQEAGYLKFTEQQKKWDTKIDKCLEMNLNEIDQCLDLYSR